MQKNPKFKFGVWVCLFLNTVIVSAAFANPPRVVKTIPENGERNVDPKLREIRAVFNQDMKTRGFSICGGGQKYPNIIGNPKWVNNRTIAMRVKLEPNHEYVFSLNCPSAKNFRSARGEPAVPYPVRFRTGPGTGGGGREGEAGKIATLSQEENLEAVKELRRAIAKNYSYRDLRDIKWSSLFLKYLPKLKLAKSAREFADVAAELLANAKDIHIWLKVDDETIGTHKRNVARNYNGKVLQQIVPNWKQLSSVVYTGQFEDGIGYILIESWSGNKAKAIEKAYEAIWEHSDAPGLIIDVRPNSGGREPLAQQVAGCFIDKPKVYAKHVYRAVDRPSGFGEVNERMLRPNKHRPKYRGKIAVLMGPANMSSCEAFLLMMKQVPDCKLIGETSYGSSGNPKPVDLGNGVTVFLPSWKALRPDGTCFESEGIKPDIIVETTPTELLDRDPVLEAALKFLRGQ